MKQSLCGMLCVLINVVLVSWAYAFPREVVIIRHAEKLMQNDPGPVLSAKGLVRSIKFANYFLDKFGEPDFIIAGANLSDGNNEETLREIQTLAPLANMMAERHPATGFPILYPYKNSEYELLVRYVLTNKIFNNKLVLICWEHSVIPDMAVKFGVRQHINSWPGEDYDSVYVLKFDEMGGVSEFEVLDGQYSVSASETWAELGTIL